MVQGGEGRQRLTRSELRAGEGEEHRACLWSEIVGTSPGLSKGLASSLVPAEQKEVLRTAMAFERAFRGCVSRAEGGVVGR